MDFHDSIDSVVANDPNSDYNAASNIDPISFSENSGVTTSILSITASTSVSTLHPQENLSNVLSNILVGWCSRKFLFQLGLPTIQTLMIYFSYHRLMKIAVNFQNQLTFGLVKKIVAKTHL